MTKKMTTKMKPRKTTRMRKKRMMTKMKVSYYSYYPAMPSC